MKITRVEFAPTKDMLQDSTTVELVDEGGGDFLTITQYDEHFKEITIRLDLKELPNLYTAINTLCNQ
jgi:hypothetical protein